MNIRKRLISALAILCAVAPYASAQTHVVSKGWNLIGNDAGVDLDPVLVFGNATKPTAVTPSVATVWTWDSAQGKWNFFAPSMTAEGLLGYAQPKGYGVLSAIKKGEGFWVNLVGEQTALSLSVTNPTSGVPFEFKGITLISMTFDKTYDYCNTTLTFRNDTAKAATVYLYFDLVSDGLVVGQTAFTANQLSAGATAKKTNMQYHICNTFSMRFNTDAGRVY